MPMIFQIESEPVTEDTLLSEDTIMESWLYDSVIDRYYKVGDDEAVLREDLLPLLLGKDNAFAELVTLGYDSDNQVISFTFHEGYQAAYFVEIYKLFQQKLNEFVGTMDYDRCISGKLVSEMNRLNSIVDNEFGDYVYTDDEYIVFDEFIRFAKIGTPYYIGVGGFMYYK